ncbi:hypothetical protein LSTR_LSTR012653 [Laodelphax striatellus]|uniref:Uncharacterized protein n=1 Tax=Laodelphax striatellus TaxID=195883 RepID=A0A482WZ71_LAOST|nr:hypothetical protein LSTR_LSTR012653 [Laodelphax striatellus]
MGFGQATQASSLFREEMEGEVGTEIKPPPVRPPNPLSDVLTVFLQPLQYLASALENILRLFAQLGQKIVVSINDKLTAILH